MPEETTKQQEARKKGLADLGQGYAIVRGTAASLDEIARIAYVAKDMRSFSLARKLFALARNHPAAAALPDKDKLKLRQQHGLCTYKDDDLVIDDRLSEALAILNGGDLLSANPSQETLGLAGSIYKQWWRYTGQRRDLENSLAYYMRGSAGDLAGDYGYTRINSAFVLDLLAYLESEFAPDSAEARRKKATALREEIVAQLPGLAAKDGNEWLSQEWWYGATMAEAAFGLGRYSEAQTHLREALKLDPAAWQLEATTRQFSALARAMRLDKDAREAASATIALLVGDNRHALDAMSSGKMGLALSGGGFRASLFHIGVLARLAELDVLRHVEVLSCVSGGSIIGAHYYLEVRRLLQSKPDADITRDDYIEIVKRVERDFLAGVQMNLRGRLFAGWIANLRSIVAPGYTRTQYLAELFEKHIYSRVEDERGERWIDGLHIVPQGGGDDFNPKLDNWRRGAKAPILLLNATTLNTGHVWQFAVNWMGEPPISTSRSVDCNDLLRRMYYREAPDGYRKIRLGLAVASSACVSGLFDPVEMRGLYPDRAVRLVDGGVHDNQGVAGLLEQECTILLVSDASGQMTSQAAPGPEPVTVLKRTQDVSMACIRESRFEQLAFQRRAGALTGLMFLHLKKDLEIEHVDWVDCEDPYCDSTTDPCERTLTPYQMPKEIQGRLAGIRTDLDTFSDAEAYALMLSGYRMTGFEFGRCIPGLPVSDAAPVDWKFLSASPAVDRKPDYEKDNRHLRKILKTGSRLPFKVWFLRPVASVLAGILGLVVLGVAGWAAWWLIQQLRQLHLPLGKPMLALAGVLLVYLLVLCRMGRKSFWVIVSGLGVVTVGWLIARLHLWLFDPLYRGAGQIRIKS